MIAAILSGRSIMTTQTFCCNTWGESKFSKK